MAVTLMLLFCAAILLAALWGVIGMISASRRPAYTFADWQNASDRIGREILRLRSATYAASDRGTYLAFLKDLHANTAFIVNMVNNARRHRPMPEAPCSAHDVLTQRAALLLRLCFVRLQLFLPHSAGAVHRHALTDAESYVCLCFALTGFLEHYVY